MAMPDDVRSTVPVPAPLTGARALGVAARIDYEDGGIALNDPSAGLLYQRWRGRLIDNDVILDAPEYPAEVIFSAPDITEISFTFDQNMRPALAFVQGGVAKLRWFDSQAGAQVVTNIGVGVINPRVILDDKRLTQVSRSDIILGYVRDGAAYYRQQRDRFLIERLYHPGPWVGLIKIGFNSQLRLQFLLRGGQ